MLVHRVEVQGAQGGGWAALWDFGTFRSAYVFAQLVAPRLRWRIVSRAAAAHQSGAFGGRGLSNTPPICLTVRLPTEKARPLDGGQCVR